MSLSRLVFCSLLASAVLTACSRDENVQSRHKPVVAVSVVPQATFVRRIAGDLVDVVVMIPPGATPETYEPTMGQRRAAANAAVYVAVGHPSFPFERVWLDSLVSDDVLVVDGSEDIAQRAGDPHVWVSPAAVRTMAVNIEGALATIMPSHRDELAANLDMFLRDIDELDVNIRAMLAPCAGKAFFVLHPAWGYFANEYDLVQVAIEHEHKSPSPARLAEMIDAAREADARAVFVQPQFAHAGASVVAEAVNADIIEADPLAADWLDNTRRVASALARALCP